VFAVVCAFSIGENPRQVLVGGENIC